MHGPESGPSYILTSAISGVSPNTKPGCCDTSSVEVSLSAELGGVCRRCHRLRVRTRITIGLSNRKGRYRRQRSDQEGRLRSQLCSVRTSRPVSAVVRLSRAKDHELRNLTAPSDTFHCGSSHSTDGAASCPMCYSRRLSEAFVGHPSSASRARLISEIPPGCGGWRWSSFS